MTFSKIQFIEFRSRISSLGYGYISPDMPHAMTASYVLAVLGQLYLAVFVLRLVALYIKNSGIKDSY